MSFGGFPKSGSSSNLTATVDSAENLLRQVSDLYHEHNARRYGPVGIQTDYRRIFSHVDTTVNKISAHTRRLMNLSCAIHRLPPEILSRIFIHIARNHSHYEMTEIGKWFPASAVPFVERILPLTLVCAHWYETLIGTAWLWSTIKVNNKKILPIGLRLRPSQMQLYAIVHTEAGPGTLDYFRSQGHRLLEYRLFNVCMDKLEKQTSFDAENLRFCEIMLKSSYTRSVPRLLSLFNGNAPRLEALLISKTIFLPANHFPSLTRLVINHYGHGGGVSFTLHDFLAFLLRCPALQEIHLASLQDCKFLKGMAGQRSLVHSPIPFTLNHLRKFSVRSDPDPTSLLSLLRSLNSVIQTTLVHLREVPAKRLTSIIEFLSNNACSLTGLRIGAFDERAEFDDSKIGNEVPEDCYSLQLVEPRSLYGGIRIDFRDQYEDEAFLDAPWFHVADMLKSPRLFDKFEMLWVSSHVRDEDLSQQFFRHLPNVTTISLSIDYDRTDDTAWKVFHGLRPGDGSCVPCPQLHTLCVEHLATSKQCQSIATLLEDRKSNGYPLRGLLVSVSPNGLDNEEIRQFEGMVKELVEELTVVFESQGDSLPDDLLWERVVPAECYDQSRLHEYWPAWY